MIRPARAAVFAAVVLQPLSATGADFVVWWEEGFYPQADEAVAEIVAAFEHKTGKDVELVLLKPEEALEKTQAAVDAGQPPDFLFGLVADAGLDQWAYEDRLVELTETVGPLASLFDADALAVSTLLNGRTGKRALYTLPMGRATNHVHVWTSLLERTGLTLADVPRDWEAFWSFWCERVQPAVRKALGRDDIWAVGLPMSLDAGDTHVQVRQFQNAYDAYWSAEDKTKIDDPAVRANLIKALEAYTAVYLTGCTPPDATHWVNRDNNDRFVAQTVVMTLNSSLSIPNAIEASRPDDYRENTATVEWPNGADGGPLAIYGTLYRGAVFRTARPSALGKEFVRFLIEDGWLAHYLDFAGDQLLPPMTKLLEQPFWLDGSDPHRMASAIQTLTRPHHYDGGIAADQVFKERTWRKAVDRVVSEGWTPEQAVDEAIARIKELVDK
jgi:multiple sugar transport system substrate-binding protein